MSEMQVIADRVVVIGRGRLIMDAPTQDLLSRPARSASRPCAVGIPVHHLAEVDDSLEDAYLRLTGDQVEFHGRRQEPERSGVRS